MSHNVMWLRRQSRDTGAVLQMPDCSWQCSVQASADKLLILLASGSVAQAVICMKRGGKPSSPVSKQSCIDAASELTGYWSLPGSAESWFYQV